MPEETKATQAGAEDKANDAGQEEAKTYTQEEVDALLQKEGDKRVTEALKTRDKTWQERIEDV